MHDTCGSLIGRPITSISSSLRGKPHSQNRQRHTHQHEPTAAGCEGPSLRPALRAVATNAEFGRFAGIALIGIGCVGIYISALIPDLISHQLTG
jgi:hypothetical protein